jgi:hypothetical protein
LHYFSDLYPGKPHRGHYTEQRHLSKDAAAIQSIAIARR